MTYIGVDSLNGDLEMALLRKVYSNAGAAPASLKSGLPGGLARRLLGGDQLHLYGAGDSGAKPARKCWWGRRSVPPGGVAVWVE